MKAAEAGKGNRNFSHFGPDSNLLAELEALFATYGETGSGKVRRYVHDAEEAAPYGRRPAPSPPWTDLPAEHRPAVLRGPARRYADREASTSASHVDLLVGVVPIINLEWIQKLHRDKTHARLLARRRWSTRSCAACRTT